jgi:hypothetical protein
MSTQNPSPSALRLAKQAEDEGGDESTNTVLWIGGGALLLLVFLAFLCVGGLLLSSVVAGHPITDIFLTPAAVP